jgi:hypothetical protein
MRYHAITAMVLTFAAASAAAQQPFMPKGGLEIRPIAGAYIPTGPQADNFKSNVLVGGQLAYEFSDHLHLLGSFAWVPQTVKFTGLASDGADIYDYNAGLEFNLLRHMGSEWLWRPFVGLGGGGRTYHYAASGTAQNSCTAGYGALGTEFQHGIYAVRFEARDNATCFTQPLTHVKTTNNDLAFSLGLVYHFRR